MKMLLMLLLALPVSAGPAYPERWYQERIAASLDGKMEVPVANGRVDVLTESHAIEVEFASKWKQSIGQALWYSLQTGKTAGVVLIIENPERDALQALRLETVIKDQKLPIRVWRWPTDFALQGLIDPK